MKQLYSISYDLRQPGRDYESLYEAIMKLGSYFHALESTWYVRTEKTANEIFLSLKGNFDNNDHIVISCVDTLQQQGWMLKSFWDWVRDESKPSVK